MEVRSVHYFPCRLLLVSQSYLGLDYSVEAVGDPELMSAALEASHKGWGQVLILLVYY